MGLNTVKNHEVGVRQALGNGKYTVSVNGKTLKDQITLEELYSSLLKGTL
ncbi:MAG: hypothetical protein KKA52_00450 [Candidatus Omnitrophica bacterium]|nr:hypothetical protein [Candidatus Omnitrophota bacterium]